MGGGVIAIGEGRVAVRAAAYERTGKRDEIRKNVRLDFQPFEGVRREGTRAHKTAGNRAYQNVHLDIV